KQGGTERVGNGNHWERPPREGKSDIRMDWSDFEAVCGNQKHAEQDNRQVAGADNRGGNNPERRGQAERRDSRCEQNWRWNPRAERSSLQFVERMRSDAHSQTERQERPGHNTRVGGGRERRPQQHVREMPRGGWRMPQRPVITPSARPESIERARSVHWRLSA